MAEDELTQLDQPPGGGDGTDPGTTEQGTTDPGTTDSGTTDRGTTDPGDPGTVYSLTGPDAQLFTVDPATGAIALQDWFTPSLDDAWDQNEDYVYELTLVTTSSDGGTPSETPLWFDTMAEGELTQLTEAPGEHPADPTAPADPTDPTDPGPGSEPGTLYSLVGPDAQLFTIDAETGAIATQDWFQPSHDDAWNQNEDHIYELTRIASFADGSPSLSENLFYQTQPDGGFGPMPQVDPLTALLALDSTSTIEDAVPDGDTDEEDLQDAML